MRYQLQGKVAVVTGSTSGIGEGIARRLAEEGASVVVCGRNREAGERVAGEIAATGGSVAFIPVDLAQPDDCRRLIAATVDHFGGLDALINDAAIFPRVNMEEANADDWWSVLQVNLVAAGLLCSAAVPHMRARGGGVIVNCGSSNAYVGGANLTPYSVSKGGLLTLTKNLASQCAKDNIRVNWITVGWVLTPGEVIVQRKEGHEPEEVREMIRHATRLPDTLTPAHLGGAIAFLLSDDATMITGCELNVSGGIIIR